MVGVKVSGRQAGMHACSRSVFVRIFAGGRVYLGGGEFKSPTRLTFTSVKPTSEAAEVAYTNHKNTGICLGYEYGSGSRFRSLGKHHTMIDRC